MVPKEALNPSRLGRTARSLGAFRLVSRQQSTIPSQSGLQNDPPPSTSDKESTQGRNTKQPTPAYAPVMGSYLPSIFAEHGAEPVTKPYIPKVYGYKPQSPKSTLDSERARDLAAYRIQELRRLKASKLGNNIDGSNFSTDFEPPTNDSKVLQGSEYGRSAVATFFGQAQPSEPPFKPSSSKIVKDQPRVSKPNVSSSFLLKEGFLDPESAPGPKDQSQQGVMPPQKDDAVATTKPLPSAPRPEPDSKTQISREQQTYHTFHGLPIPLKVKVQKSNKRKDKYRDKFTPNITIQFPPPISTPAPPPPAATTTTSPSPNPLASPTTPLPPQPTMPPPPKDISPRAPALPSTFLSQLRENPSPQFQVQPQQEGPTEPSPSPSHQPPTPIILPPHLVPGYKPHIQPLSQFQTQSQTTPLQTSTRQTRRRGRSGFFATLGRLLRRTVLVVIGGTVAAGVTYWIGIAVDEQGGGAGARKGMKKVVISQ